MEFVLVGQVVASFGLEGWVKVLSLSDVPGRFSSGVYVWVEGEREKWEEIIIEKVVPQGKVFLIRFAGVTSRQEADRLRGRFLAVPREKVPSLAKGNFYHFELLGLWVKEKEQYRGRVVSVVEGPSYDYLLVQNDEGKEFFLPFIRAYIQEVNLEAKLIQAECPEGFWE
ncbi:MAG: ribosome maturation factor RimM [Candidatus Caldatribacteriaceae bacterium]